MIISFIPSPTPLHTPTHMYAYINNTRMRIRACVCVCVGAGEGIKETPVPAMGYTSIGESRKQYWCNPTAVLPWGCDYIGIRNYILREHPAWPDRNP